MFSPATLAFFDFENAETNSGENVVTVRDASAPSSSSKRAASPLILWTRGLPQTGAGDPVKSGIQLEESNWEPGDIRRAILASGRLTRAYPRYPRSLNHLRATALQGL